MKVNQENKIITILILKKWQLCFQSKRKSNQPLYSRMIKYIKYIDINNTIEFMSCDSSCLTCTDSFFYSCTSCADAAQLLSGSLCLTTPTIYYQIATTCMIFLFILPVLLRKRSLVMVKIVDFIQIAAYFKLIKGYTSNRHIWLYLGMRSWAEWSEGWSIIGGDTTVPIWTTEEGIINKSIRICATWVFFVLVAFCIGLLKSVLDERDMTLRKYISKSMGNYFSYAFYFTLQDISFVIATPILNPNFDTTFNIVAFAISIFFCILVVLFLIWSFCRINFQDPQQKYYHYKYLFFFSADYDLFPTYDLLDLPTKAKQIKKLSNIRLFDMIKKIGYAFLIVSYLSSPTYKYETSQDEIFQILGYLVFFQIIWLIVMPFNLRREYLQFILSILAFGVTLYLLFAPWYITEQIVNTALVLALFGLGLASIIIQFCFNIYKLVPVDLFQTGLKVVIEDHRLLKQIAMRRKDQEQMERRLKQMEQNNKNLKKEMQEKEKAKLQKTEPKLPVPIPVVNQVRQDSQVSLAAHKQVLKTKSQLGKEVPPQNEQQFVEQDGSMNSQDIAQLYKVDDLKRRKVYQWNKQQPFVYSNKMQ